MILLIPVGTEDAPPRVPRATLAILLACVVVFLFTHGEDDRLKERDLAKLADVAGWTLEKAARSDPELSSARSRYGSPLDYLAADPTWRDHVADEDLRAGLERALADYQAFRARHPFYRYGFVPAHITPVRLVAHQFLHGDILHILFNMIFLWVTGGLLEAAWGAPLYVAFYLVSGMAAALSHAALNAGSQEPAIGASGAIAGLMGAFAVTLGKQRIRFAMVAMIAIAPRIQVFSAPAWIFLGFWFLEQLGTAFLFASTSLPIAFGAHIGGFLFGALAALGLHRWWTSAQVAT